MTTLTRYTERGNRFWFDEVVSM